MGARARGALGGALTAAAAVAAGTVLGLLIPGPGPGLAGLAAAQPLGPAATVPGAQHAPPDGCCRWELATLVPFEQHWAALEQGGASGGAIEAFPPVVLLDQCSGRTWTLGWSPGPGGHDWRLLRRQGID